MKQIQLHHDIHETLLNLTLNTNQSIMVYFFVFKVMPFTFPENIKTRM